MKYIGPYDGTRECLDQVITDHGSGCTSGYCDKATRLFKDESGADVVLCNMHYHRRFPIYGTDFSKGPMAAIEKVRGDLVRLRGNLSDLAGAYPGYKESLDDAGGTMTLVISYLYYVNERIAGKR